MLRDVELELLNKVIPEYRDAAARGQIELSASPFYHPILPLLCDTDIYLRTHPDSHMPRLRFQHPEDAAEQLERASASHERLFGRRPVGLWPSEGSVSDAMVSLAARAGFRWMATDELILARTLGVTFSRDGRGHVEQPERLYTPYIIRAAGAAVACTFRDHVLSDLIGFTYSGWAAEAAADDFVARLVEAGRRYRERTGGGEALIPIILDGENAWEHFEGGGRPFLRALYRRLSGHPELRTVTMAEACAGAKQELAGVFPGSWIDANFYIWIGHADDQKAWSQLADAHAALDSATRTARVDPAALAEAHEELLIAEGSDWFWWVRHTLLGARPGESPMICSRWHGESPTADSGAGYDELFVSNISTSASPVTQTEPTALLAPALDGEETSYFEWLGAGTLEIREVAGAMHQSERRPAVVTLVHFGFDRERLFVRVDATQRVLDLLTDGREFSLKFFTPAGVRFSVRQVAGRLVGTFWDRQPAEPFWLERGPGGATVAAGTVLELALPLADLGLGAGQPVAFFVAVFDDRAIEIERHPPHRPIELAAPDALFTCIVLAASAVLGDRTTFLGRVIRPAAWLLPQILPAFSVVAPCHPGAALLDFESLFTGHWFAPPAVRANARLDRREHLKQGGSRGLIIHSEFDKEINIMLDLRPAKSAWKIRAGRFSPIVYLALTRSRRTFRGADHSSVTHGSC